MSTLAEDIIALFEANGFGTYAVDLFRDFSPAEPDAIGMVYDTGGPSGVMAFGSKAFKTERPTASVQFRGDPHDTDGPKGKALSAYVLLGTIELEPVNGVLYSSIRALQRPMPIDTDEQERVIWGFNVIADVDRY